MQKAVPALPPRRYVDKRETAAISLAGGGQNLSFAMISGHLLYFYTNIFRIDPRIVSGLFFVMGIWDIVNNPLMGMLVDRTRTRYGKLLPYLRGFSLPLLLATAAIFAGPLLLPDPSPTAPAKVAYMFVSYVVWEMLYTATDVAFWGLTSAMTPETGERTRIQTVLNFSIMIFSALPFIVFPLLIDFSAAAGSAINLKTAFAGVGIAGSVLGVGLFLLAGLFVKERIAQSEEPSSFRESLAQLKINKPLRMLIYANILNSMRGVGFTMEKYYNIDVLGYASMDLLANIPATVVSSVAFPLIPWFKKRWDNRQISIYSYLSIAAVCVLTFLPGLKYYNKIAVMLPLTMLRYAWYALFGGILSVVPREMMSETTDYAEWTTGKRSEGVSFSLQATTVKLSSTIAQSIGAMLLSAIGYKTSAKTAHIPQTPQVQFRIFLVYEIVPVLFIVASVIPYLFYDLVGEKRERMLQELAERRAQVNRSYSLQEPQEQSL